MIYHTDNIAILMATCQGEKYVSEQIESILNQSCREWELFIHDDGSSDGTQAILHSYEARYPERIHVIDAPACGGAKNNFFCLMSRVDAPYIMFCDQDDIWMENKISAALKSMKEAEEDAGANTPVLVFSDLIVVDSELKLISNSMFRYQKLEPGRISFSELLVQNVVSGCTMMINRKLLQMSLKVVSLDSVIMHDWWCALVAARYGVICRTEAGILYRQHNSNSVGASNMNSASYILKKSISVRKLRRALLAHRRQAAAFAEAYGSEENLLAEEFSRISEKGKLERMIFLRKNNIDMSGFARKAAFRILS